MWTVVPSIYKVLTAPHIYASIFSCRQLTCYWCYLDNSMRLILHSWCQIQRTSSNLRYVNCGPGHIQWNDNTTYSVFNIQLNVSALQLEINGHVDARYTANLVANTAHILRFTLSVLWSRTYTMHLQLHIFRLQYSFERICPAIGDTSTFQCMLYCKFGVKYSAHRPVYAVNCGPGHIQCSYSSAYSGLNIQLNISALQLEINGHADARYTVNLVPNTAHIPRFMPCVLWSRTYTNYILVLIVRLQYSTEPICATIGYNRSCRCALYC
jgi:hypothetical protein